MDRKRDRLLEILSRKTTRLNLTGPSGLRSRRLMDSVLRAIVCVIVQE
jgi:hypothetical protein